MSQPARWMASIGRRTWLSHLRDLKLFDVELEPVLRDAAQEADRLVRSMVGDDIGTVARRAQLAQSARALRQLHTDLFDEVNRTTGQAIARTSRTATQGLLELNAQLFGAFSGDLMRDTFAAAARNGAESVRSRLVNNIPLSSRVYKTRALSQGWVQRAINRGLATNKSAAEIARDVRRLIDPRTPGGVSYAAKRLGRTEINNAFHTTSIRTAAAQPWTEGLKWNLSNSHPRSDPCDDYANEDSDGLGKGVFKPNNVPRKPHPQCLCYTTVVTVDEDEFIEHFLSGKYDRWLRETNPQSVLTA